MDPYYFIESILVESGILVLNVSIPTDGLVAFVLSGAGMGTSADDVSLVFSVLLPPPHAAKVKGRAIMAIALQNMFFINVFPNHSKHHAS